MAGTLLHILLAEKALAEATIPTVYKDEMRRHRDSYRLGSVVFDLPYYEGLLRQAIMRQTKRDYRYAAWGQKLHLRAPKALCRALLDAADSPSGRALAFGALTHAAVDTVFHPEIERRVLQSEEGRARPNRAHHRIETQMDIHVHAHYLGTPGIGTADTARALVLHPDANWSALFRTAIGEVHGEAPSHRRILSWLRSLRLFARLHSRPHPWVPRKAPEDSALKEPALAAAVEGIARAARYLEIACARLDDREGPDDRFAEIPDVNLADGGSPLPAIGTPK